MTILWSFSFYSFVKFQWQKNWEPQHDHVMQVFKKKNEKKTLCTLGWGGRGL